MGGRRRRKMIVFQFNIIFSQYHVHKHALTMIKKGKEGDFFKNKNSLMEKDQVS
jgi:hypothetical protein